MNLLIDAVAAFSGAGPTHVRELASTLPELGTTSRILFIVQPSLEALVRDIAPEAEVISPPPRWARPPARLIWENFSLPGVAARWGADVVYSPFNTLPLVWPRSRPRLAILLFNLAPYAPTVLGSLGVVPRFRLQTLRLVTNRTIDIADRVFVLSSQARELVGKRLTPDKTTMLRVSSPGTVSQRQASIPIPDVPFFVVAGDLIPHKGMDAVIEALKYLRSRASPPLLLCGRPLDRRYAAALERQVDEAGLGGQVRMLGWLEHTDVMSLMANSVACIVPSRFENMSLVPFEAMAAGTAVIASRIPVFEENCANAALYFGLDDHRGLAKHMLSLLEDGKGRATMIQRGRDHILARGPSLAAQVLRSLLELGERPP